MGLLNFFQEWSDEFEKEDARKEKERLENEMDDYDLNDEEKELVRKHGYEPSDFEYGEDYDDMDDDDYYGEDY